MRPPVPLGRFPLLSHTEIDAVLGTLNASVGGERNCRSVPARRERYDFNFLRLGPARIISQSTTACTVHHRQDAAGAFCLCLDGFVEVTQGSRVYGARAGQLLCLLPGAERTFEYGEGFRSFGVRIEEADLGRAMHLLGYENAAAWNSITTVLPETGPEAGRFCRYIRDVVRIYDDGDEKPDRRVDVIMGRNLVTQAASMLGAIVPDRPRLDGPSYAVAEAAEQVIAERFASPLTASDIAEAVGQTLPCLRASLLLYTGLLAEELLTLVRLVAADEYVRRSHNDPASVAKACGFVTERRYRAAMAQRERLESLLKKRMRGRGFAS